MSDMEKVIKGLEVTESMLTKAVDRGGEMAVTCAFNCLNNVTRAIALLKEQGARVMTLDEVKAFDWDYCYLEEERLPGKEYRAVCGDYALTCITWPCVASMRIQHGDESYGKKWRCWSAKPTDEQRKAMKGNEQDTYLDKH